MPLYEYRCESCGGLFELIQKFSDPAPDACTVCGKGPVLRQHSSPAIQFKGSGWYITDYARKGKVDTSSSDGGSKNAAAKTDGSASGTSAGTDGGASATSTTPAKGDAPAAAKPSSAATGAKE